MKAARMHKTGGPDVLVYEDVPEPRPAPGEVLIKVEAVSVNYADAIRRRGERYPYPSPPPFILGGEVAGTVVGHGEGVSSPDLGSRVFALLGGGGAGGYAQLAVADPKQMIVLPSRLDDDLERACTLVVAGVTALQCLRELGRLAPGESVLIPGAAGGVGTYALQIARALGAGKIIAGASTVEKRVLALRLGADHVIDHRSADWPKEVKELTNGRGADVVLDLMSGGPVFEQGMSALAPFGRLVVYGVMNSQPTSFEPRRLVAFNQSIAGYYVNEWFVRGKGVAALGALIGLIQAGKVKAEIGHALPLSRAAEAHRLIEERRTLGKIVLKPWAEDRA